MYKSLLKREGSIKLYKCSGVGCSYYLVTCKDKRFIRSSLNIAQVLFNELVNKKSQLQLYSSLALLVDNTALVMNCFSVITQGVMYYRLSVSRLNKLIKHREKF